MLTLFDALYNCGFDGDLSRWLLPEESEDYQMASDNRERLRGRMETILAPEDQVLLERLMENTLEAGERECQLSFRRGLTLGLKLGSLTSWGS